MLTIGFANHYYTLWSVSSFEKYDAQTGETILRTNYTYYQNLSMDFNTAKNKIAVLTDNYEIDLDLRGANGSYWTERRIKDMHPWLFSFGKLIGTDIRNATDAWQLHRAMREESSLRRRVYARRRLLELGELVLHSWIERIAKWNYETEEPYTEEIIHKYCPIKKYEFLKKKEAENQLQGHFFTDGERITLNIKPVRITSFDTQYGTTYIQTFITPDNQIVKYKGSSPINVQSDEYIQVKATIEHTVYQEINETRLKRIKIS